jgi:hypothetical protein
MTSKLWGFYIALTCKCAPTIIILKSIYQCQPENQCLYLLTASGIAPMISFSNNIRNFMAKKIKKGPLKPSPTQMNITMMVIFALVFGVVGYLIRTLTHAAPASSGPSSIVLDQTDTYLGSNITFKTIYPKIKGNITPRIAVWCFQDLDGDGVIKTSRTVENKDYVYAEAGSADQNQQKELTGNPGFTLGGGGSIWKTGGGPATCNAELFYYSYSGKQQIYNYLAETPNWQAGAAR